VHADKRCSFPARRLPYSQAHPASREIRFATSHAWTYSKVVALTPEYLMPRLGARRHNPSSPPHFGRVGGHRQGGLSIGAVESLCLDPGATQAPSSKSEDRLRLRPRRTQTNRSQTCLKAIPQRPVGGSSWTYLSLPSGCSGGWRTIDVCPLRPAGSWPIGRPPSSSARPPRLGDRHQIVAGHAGEA